jgi:hypothetical protein
MQKSRLGNSHAEPKIHGELYERNTLITSPTF